jgi:hypothetical protein
MYVLESEGGERARTSKNVSHKPDQEQSRKVRGSVGKPNQPQVQQLDVTDKIRKGNVGTNQTYPPLRLEQDRTNAIEISGAEPQQQGHLQQRHLGQTHPAFDIAGQCRKSSRSSVGQPTINALERLQRAPEPFDHIHGHDGELVMSKAKPEKLKLPLAVLSSNTGNISSTVQGQAMSFVPAKYPSLFQAGTVPNQNEAPDALRIVRSQAFQPEQKRYPRRTFSSPMNTKERPSEDGEIEQPSDDDPDELYRGK